MSVLIKGIKMPKSCLQCGACIEGDCDFCYCGYDQDEREIELKFNYRPKWCPLVEAVEQPIKFGKWKMAFVTHRLNRAICSCCNWSTDEYGAKSYNFCPNCGAVMSESLKGKYYGKLIVEGLRAGIESDGELNG